MGHKIKLKQEVLPWYAPQNQICLFPWILSNSFKAFNAATVGIGWAVDHLNNICFGGCCGLRVTRKGGSVCPTLFWIIWYKIYS